MREETLINAVNDIDTIARLTEDLYDKYYNNEPDYWEKLKHQYAGMAMQGILANPEMVALYDIDVAETAIRIANITIEKLKEKSQCEK
jgi:hypothetical protein